MNESLRDIDMIPFEPARRKLSHEPCSPEEISHIRRVAGELNYIGFRSCPSDCYAASELLSRLAQPTVGDVVFARKTPRSLQSLESKIHYRRPTTSIRSPTYFTYSDASARKSAFVQTGYLSGIIFNLLTTIGRLSGLITNNTAYLSRPWVRKY